MIVARVVPRSIDPSVALEMVECIREVSTTPSCIAPAEHPNTIGPGSATNFRSYQLISQVFIRLCLYVLRVFTALLLRLLHTPLAISLNSLVYYKMYTISETRKKALSTLRRTKRCMCDISARWGDTHALIYPNAAVSFESLL